MSPAKPLDKLHKNYERKTRLLQKTGASGSSSLKFGRKATSNQGSTNLTKGKTELKTVEQVRKARKIMEKKKAKNALSTFPYHDCFVSS